MTGIFELVAQRHITAFVADFCKVGTDAFRETCTHPVLVQVAAAAKETDFNYDTALATGATLEAIRELARVAAHESTPSSRSPHGSGHETTGASLVPGDVVQIVKKGGSAFRSRIGVGRARNVDVCLMMPKISKYHGYFSEGEDGSYTFTDAGSTNGSFVNAKRLEPKQAVSLTDGTEIAFGPYRFAFYTPAGFCEIVARRAALQ